MFMFGYYTLEEKVNKCTSDPIKFGVEKIRENYDAEYVYGSVTILKDKDSKTWRFGDEIDLLNP